MSPDCTSKGHPASYLPKTSCVALSQHAAKRPKSAGPSKVNTWHWLCQTGLPVTERTWTGLSINTVSLSNTFQVADMHPVSPYYHQMGMFRALTYEITMTILWISIYGNKKQTKIWSPNLVWDPYITLKTRYNKQSTVLFSLQRVNNSVGSNCGLVSHSFNYIT